VEEKEKEARREKDGVSFHANHERKYEKGEGK
jgi:hypothetical protein